MNQNVIFLHGHSQDTKMYRNVPIAKKWFLIGLKRAIIQRAMYLNVTSYNPSFRGLL